MSFKVHSHADLKTRENSDNMSTILNSKLASIFFQAREYAFYISYFYGANKVFVYVTDLAVSLKLVNRFMFSLFLDQGCVMDVGGKRAEF